ncbi:MULTISPECIES: hypothetical protein [Metabacillus]|uniref:Uncharacterized protein n=1 Tax=Metabacillus hrfriensis TaxID=3048891 RepID=A0ACD4RHU4_9BACI|nr:MULTISPECIES: hypothetical protein [Metabacillus]UAL54482.1 hypothetical protein K8L98_12270 [Metabacillus dongyingensis]UOK56192.1 hypothetical protein MGI18_14265 [Bacillus sp. OVS6]USK30787.1 hypothetical protein LIT32_12085 [Bacillus sp. CMF21]WHZ60044.1 hypothetical protein QLQ22_12240 [Metabacillus sp. CT-WN-B3]
MTLLYEILYLPTNSGTIRIDLSYKRSFYIAHAELLGHLSSGKDRNKRNAIKKSLLELSKQVQSG